jgi:hypothetical protein
MKNLTNGIIGLSISIGLTGCGGVSWINLDKSEADEKKITKAEKKCNVNKKLYKLSIDKDGVYDMIHILNAKGKAKDDLLKLHQIEEDKVHNEINTCMEQEGLTKAK